MVNLYTINLSICTLNITAGTSNEVEVVFNAKILEKCSRRQLHAGWFLQNSPLIISYAENGIQICKSVQP